MSFNLHVVVYIRFYISCDLIYTFIKPFYYYVYQATLFKMTPNVRFVLLHGK